ncbi:MAG: biliverdin-producing heme oxygenase [Chloroflexales bacterium]|nr:biliverdin-producing heme oxygenase [Chloroflexales bacterium]
MILPKLKQATQHAHEQIEANAHTASIMQGTISLDQYVWLLQKFFGFYAPMEAAMSRMTEWESIGLKFEQRRKTPLLEKDLRILGSHGQHLAALPICTDLPTIVNFPQALGCLYVFEGATLGGQLITRQLQRLFGFDRETGCAFFSSYGSRVGPMWKAFGAALNSYAGERDVDHIMIDAACASFSKLDRWLSTPVTLDRENDVLDHSHIQRAELGDDSMLDSAAL